MAFDEDDKTIKAITYKQAWAIKEGSTLQRNTWHLFNRTTETGESTDSAQRVPCAKNY